MNYARQVSRTLDEEHRASLDLLGRIEAGFGRARTLDPALVGALVRQLEHEVTRHFEFEEEQLFPRLAQVGDGDIVALLAEEHAAIRGVAAEVLPLARAAAAGTLAEAEWKELKRGALELVERQVAHIQKESMALLPMLEDLLDDETDRELAFAYAAA
jgi:hemerythrin-like domain-containing protein